MDSAIAEPLPTGRLQCWAVAALLLGIGLYRLADTAADPDLWGHVRFGQDILRDGEIPATDPYSYLSAGREWINHEWLAEVLFALAYDTIGSPGLIFWKLASGLTILGLSFRFLVSQGLAPPRSAMLLLPLILLLLPGLGCVRPQLFTCLLCFLTLLALAAADRGQRSWLWSLPVIFVLWVNLHGGFLAGLAVLLFWTAVHGLTTRKEWRWLPTVGLPAAAAGLATLLNPYGPRLHAFLLETATIPRPDIAEWAPLRLLRPEGGLYLIYVAAAVLGILFSRRRRSPALLAVLACLAIGPLVSKRHLPLFAAAVPVLAGEHIADAWQRWSPEEPARAMSKWLAAACAGAAVVLAGLALTEFTCIRLAPEMGFRYPCRAVARIQASGVQGRMVVFFDWGEYVIWHLGPGVQVSIDGRRETVYSEAVRRLNTDFMKGAGDWQALLTEGSPDLLLVPRAAPVFELLKKQPGWILLDDPQDRLSALFVPAGSPVLATAPANWPDDGRGLCFPVAP